MKQTTFSFLKDYRKEFGGSKLVGHRKSMRPLSTKQPIHLILKASNKRYFHPGQRSLENLIRKTGHRFGVKIYNQALNWTHVHLLIQVPSRHAYKAFIKVLVAELTKQISKTYKTTLKSILDLRPYTRIVSWGREFKILIQYHELNRMEACGLIRRPKKLKKNMRVLSECLIAKIALQSKPKIYDPQNQ